MRKQKLLPLLLAMLLLASSCGSTTEVTETTAAVTETVTETEPVDPLLQYDPGFAEEDHGGASFCVLYGDNDFEPNLDVCAEELKGDPMNDAIFNRNIDMENKYNIEFSWDRNPSGGAFNGLRTSVNAGEDRYSIFTENGVHSFNAATQGLTQQLTDFPHLDFDKPYWNKGMLQGASINHKNYFAYSDINIHALGATPCVLFNKNVAESFGIDDLYTLTEEGKWTFETMGNYITMVTTDLNGDGEIKEEDRHGFIGNTFVIDCFLSGTGYQTITKDENDMPILNIQTEEYYNIIEAIQKLCSEDTGSFICDRYAGVDREYAPMDALAEDRALFWIANLKGVERMREMESPFGILPIPKLNDAQEEYKIHYQANIGGAMSVPMTVADRELVGKMLEDMSYISMRNVKPAYIDVLITGKFLRDEESLLTLDIMFDSYYSDIGFMTGTILTPLRGFVQNNSTKYVSSIQSSLKSIQTNLDKAIKTYMESEQ